MNLKGAIGVGHGAERALKPLDVGCLLDWVNEALIPNSSARKRFRHLLASNDGFLPWQCIKRFFSAVRCTAMPL